MDLVGIEEVYEGVDRSLKDHTFRQFDLYNNESRFTASPGPEVDNAWEEIGAGKNSVFLPLRFGHIFGLDPRRYFHNQLRKSLYYNHEYYKAHGAHLKETEAEHRAHINHCIDIIRERVMCTADAGVIPTAWGPGEINFATPRKCHDHKSFLNWVNKNKITEEDKADPLVDWNRVPVPSNAILGAAGYHLPTVG
ncbi:hypothetical protein HII31_10546 [Pseudocercospora fuligena]|uniref:Tat pathway signal sequence protein n=1 Tax=Pseudocercospora fuligena TaxID=685502 RepID=A0A8H6RAM3_9PEZI|nr:hypothetical protein HII31_10546 [Pseudocercospora fuligena]